MTPKVPLVPFNNGEKYPIFGLGTWKSEPGKVRQAVKDAIDAGYTHIDCAIVYGNEHEVGEALAEKFADGAIKREDLYITGKLWCNFHRADLVEVGCKKSLDLLQLSYLDMYLIHWPMAYKEGDDLFPKDENGKTLYSEVSYLDTWKEMEKLVSAGLVKSIGVSNFNSRQLGEILEIATIKPVVNQVECHPYMNQNKLKAFCEARNVRLQAYSPLGSGDRPWANTDKTPVLLKDGRLKALTEKYGKSAAQILLRFQVQRGVMTLAKSVNKKRIISNLDIFNFSLSDDDMKELESWDQNVRYCHLNWTSDHKDYPFHEEF